MHATQTTDTGLETASDVPFHRHARKQSDEVIGHRLLMATDKSCGAWVVLAEAEPVSSSGFDWVRDY